MNIKRKAGAAALAIIAALSLSGCQGVAVPAGKTAILVDDYAMVPADPTVFDCQDPETTKQYWNVKEFDYPTRQISYEASDDYKDADQNGLVDDDSPAERRTFTVVSNAKSPAEMKVPVTVTFDLTEDCEKLKQFHRDFGSKYLPNDQDKVDVDKTSQWVDLLNYVIGQPLEQTLIRISQKYEWRQIWNDEQVRGEYIAALQEALPKESAARTNNTDYFTNFRVTVGKPDPVDANLKAAITREQQAKADAQATESKGVADANARKAQAEADVEAAKAETAVAQQEALTRAAAIAGYPDPETYLRAKAIEAGITPWPAPILVGGPPR